METEQTTESAGPSYHDVVVFVNGERYRIKDNYAYQLTCTRAGGWNLWHIWGGKETLIGGEYNFDDFRIEVRGVVVCQSSRERV